MRENQRTELEQQGFTRFEKVLPVSLLADLRRVTDDLLNQRDNTPFQSQGSMLPATEHPLFASLIALPEALACLAQLGFADPAYSDGYIISKPPKGMRLFWHYDWFAWQDERSYQNPPPQVFVMYYLTDTTRENGCLRVIPGSHLSENPLHRLLGNPHSKDLFCGGERSPTRVLGPPGRSGCAGTGRRYAGRGCGVCFMPRTRTTATNAAP